MVKQLKGIAYERVHLIQTYGFLFDLADIEGHVYKNVLTSVNVLHKVSSVLLFYLL